MVCTSIELNQNGELNCKTLTISSFDLIGSVPYGVNVLYLWWTADRSIQSPQSSIPTRENAPTVHSGFYSSDKKVHLIKNIHLKKISNKKKFQWKSPRKNKKFYSYIFNKKIKFQIYIWQQESPMKNSNNKKRTAFQQGSFPLSSV